MANPAKIRFFDALAGKWDQGEDLKSLEARLCLGLEKFALGPDERILDVGCGTGNLTKCLLGRLSDQGRILALDVSSEMLHRARRKLRDPRVTWLLADASDLPLDAGSVDRVICFSVWPHFDDARGAAREFRRVLRPDGRLHVWHLASKETINEIHASADPSVAADLLASAEETAQLLASEGFQPYEIVDEQTRYLVSAAKPWEGQ